MTNTITLAQAQQILKVLRKMDPTAELHSDYSGKFMFGAKCIGYSAHNAAIVGSGIAMVLSTDKDIDLLEILEDSRTDSLGLGEIAYYPLLQLEDEAA
jgi:hypothetical protein